MKKQYVGFAVWLLLACLLYFFENNTGTRIVLACTLLLPFIPMIRRSLFENETVSKGVVYWLGVRWPRNHAPDPQ